MARATRDAMSPGRCLTEIKEVILRLGLLIAMGMLQNDGELELVANSRFPRVMSRPSSTAQLHDTMRRTTMASIDKTHGYILYNA